MKKIIRPTIDCNNCGKDGVDENGEFRCEWRYPKPVVVIEDNRCFHALQINKVYDEAVMRSEIMSMMVESSLAKEDLIEIREYVKDKLERLENENNFRSA